MTDEKTLKRWAINDMLDAARRANSGSLYSAMCHLNDAKRWLEQAIEAELKREAKEAADKIAAAYTDLADAA